MQNPKHKDAIYTQKDIKKQNTSGGQFENIQSTPPVPKQRADTERTQTAIRPAQGRLQASGWAA